MTEHRAECRGECHADLCIHLDLIDARHLVLDRFLDRDDFPIGTVHVIEASVKSGGLPRSGGTGHQNDAVGHLDQTFKGGLVVAEETQLWQAQHE